jgi:hypothetical protein
MTTPGHTSMHISSTEGHPPDPGVHLKGFSQSWRALSTGAKFAQGFGAVLSVVGIGYGIYGTIDAASQIKEGSDVADEFRKGCAMIRQTLNR